MKTSLITSYLLEELDDFPSEYDTSPEEMLNSAAPSLPEELVRGTLAVMLWLGYTTNEDGDDEEPLEVNHSVDDFAPEAIARVRQHCESFWEEAWPMLEGADMSQAGHDLACSGCSCGVGFWDDGGRHYSEEHARPLDELAKKHFRFESAYVGDDGLLYVDLYEPR